MALTALLRAPIASALLVASCSRSEAPTPRARPELAPSARIASVRAEANVAPSAAPAPIANAAPLADTGGAEARLPPLAGTEPLVALEVEGAEPAVVALPLGTTRARPVAIALHGNFDRPEWQCEVWRGVLGARGFILCPRGIPRRDVSKSLDRWEYGSAKAVEKEIDRGLAALRARYGAYVDGGPSLFIGFSLGAIYGSSIVQKHPQHFPRVVLVEGGESAWTRASASKFVSGGGLRLYVACGQIACLAQVKRLRPALEKAGLPMRGGGHAKAGHTYDGAVAAAVASELPWLLEGDPRWEL
jgi:predicted esterase